MDKHSEQADADSRVRSGVRRRTTKTPAPPKRGWRVLIAYLSGQRGLDSELNKIRVALAVIFSAAIAGLAVGYSSSFVATAPWPVVIGVSWTVMIANLDAMIVALLGDRAGAARWAAVGPRVIIVAIGAALFAESISIRVFQPELEEHLARHRLEAATTDRARIEASYTAATALNNAKFSGDITQHENAVAGLQSQIASAEDRRRLAGREAVDAIKNRRLYYDRDGNSYYDSTASRAAQAEEQRTAAVTERLHADLQPQFERERAEVERLRSQQIVEQTRIDKRREDDLAALATLPSATGLIARVRALSEICAESTSVWWFRTLLALFLMALELLPTIAKLGERSDSACIRERLHRLLREALQSPEMKERLRLWMESSSHRYVEHYLRDVDAEMAAPQEVTNEADLPRSVDPSEAADQRVRDLIQRRAETTPQHRDASYSGSP